MWRYVHEMCLCMCTTVSYICPLSYCLPSSTFIQHHIITSTIPSPLSLLPHIKARETGEWFSNEFRKAMLPLYSVQQGVVHSQYFDDAGIEIGRFPDRVIPETLNEMKIMRNVTGICDDPTLQLRWREIVEPVNQENDLDGVVFPLPYPLTVRVVPKHGDRAAGVERQLVVAGHLDQFSGLHRIAVARRDL